MAKNLKTGILITGDSKGAVKALELTGDEVDVLGKKTRNASKEHRDASKSIVGGFSDMATSAAKWGAAIGAAAAATTAAMVKAGLESVDVLAKQSDKLGLSTEALASYRFAAEQTGIAQEKADVALQRFTRRLADAAAGTGPAVAAFDALGLSSKELIELSPDQAFAKVADQMNKVENQSQKVSLAFKLFDSEGVGLVNTMALGSEGLAAMAKEAEVLGLTLDRVDAAKVEEANDSMNKIGKAFSGLSQQLAIKFAPLLNKIADYFFNVAEEAGGMGNVADKAFKAMVKGAGLLGNSIRLLQLGWSGMKGAFQGAALFISQNLEKLFNGAIDLYNKLPWVDKVQYTTAFSDFSASMEAALRDSQAEVDRLLSKPLPSEVWEDFTVTVERESTEQARAAVASQNAIQGAMIDTEAVTAQLATTTKKTAKEVKTEWDKALEGTVNRIDGAFASAWSGAFDSFTSFADSLKDAFKNLLAELAHLAITRPIVMQMGAAVGLGGGSSAASAGGGSGFGSLAQMGSSAYSAFGSGVAGVGQSFGNTVWGVSPTLGGGIYQAGYGINSSLGLSTSSGANFAAGGIATAGAGFVGNYVGSQIFDQSKYSGYGGAGGAMAGAYAGSAIFPGIGTVIGAALGALFGNGLGSMFGREKPDLYRGTLDFNTNSLVKRGNRGHDMDEGAQNLADMFLGLGNMVGATGNFDFSLHGADGIRYKTGADRKIYGDDFESFFDDLFDDMVASSDTLNKTLKSLFTNFQGTAEQTALFAESIIGINELIQFNPIDAAVSDFADAQEAAGRSLMAVYGLQIDGIQTLITNFDGSAVAAQELNAAMSQNKQFAYEMALGIQALNKDLSAMLGSSAEQIRNSVLSEKELDAQNRAQRNQLRSQIGTLTDPEEIARVTAELNRLQGEIFSALTPEQQAARAEDFASYLERIDEVSTRQLDRSLESVRRSQNELNQMTNQMLQDSASAMSKATQDFGAYVNNLVTNGITIRVDTTGGIEVVT